ncbi:hypothetical protein M413DRAFT_439732 [Hebeloma cylindrosporum]|uniref:SCP domain-containing protein n=1 Tax=Hebeloma cylindrosporum TaxID=76867 RepID=A0A0C3CW08_HEBCY|nr:hypothetical protein M413DRAFT_439732 [Hebeloma cylindrosporum h7]
MGNDPWGSVVQKADAAINWDSVISQACGSAAPSSAALTRLTSTASETATVRAPAGTPSSSANRLTSSVVSSTVTSSSTVVSSTASSTSVQNFVASIRPSSTRAPLLSTTTSTTTPQTRFSTTRTVVQPSPTPSQSPPPNKSSGSPSADIQVYLRAHNSVRSQHGAVDLTWSDDLAAKAQQWANGCQFKHSGGSLGPFGENLAAGTGSYSFQSGMDAWVAEISEYNPNNPVPSHFTQVVWKGTTQVGCAVSTCSGIFDAKFGPAQYYVCEYSAQGNIIGRFAQNVQV